MIEFMLKQVFGRILGLILIIITIYPFVSLIRKFQRIKGTKYKRGIMGLANYLLDTFLDSHGSGYLVGPWILIFTIGVLMAMFGC